MAEANAEVAAAEAEAKAKVVAAEAEGKQKEAEARKKETGKAYSDVRTSGKLVVKLWAKAQWAKMKNVWARADKALTQLTGAATKEEKVDEVDKAVEVLNKATAVLRAQIEQAKLVKEAEKAKQIVAKKAQEAAKKAHEAAREVATAEQIAAEREKALAEAELKASQARAELLRLQAEIAKSKAKEEDLSGAKGVHREGGPMSAQQYQEQAVRDFKQLAEARAAFGEAQRALATLRTETATAKIKELQRARRSVNEDERKEIDRQLFEQWRELRSARDERAIADAQRAATQQFNQFIEALQRNPELLEKINKIWDAPLFSRTFEGSGRTPSKEDVRNAVADAVERESDRGTAA